MKNLILFIPIFFILISCGPSQKEKEEIAILTCNIMSESRNMDASVRLKEINAAREQIGEERYLSTDDGIKEAFKYGLCKELVLNNDYQNKLEEAKNLEKAIKEKAKETRRQEEAKIEAENKRIRAENERIRAVNEIKRKRGQQDWRTAVNEFINKNNIELILFSFDSFGTTENRRVEIKTTCRGPDIVMSDVPWRGNLIVKYKDNRKDFVVKNDGGRGFTCGDFVSVKIGKEEVEDYISNIDNISLEINMAPKVPCSYMSKNKDNPYDVLCPSNYPDLGEDLFMDNPITLNAKFNIDRCGKFPTFGSSEYIKTIYWDSKIIDLSESELEECP